MTQNKPGRPTKVVSVPPAIDPTLDQGKIAQAVAVYQADTAAAAQEDLADLCELAADVGALRAMELTRTFVAAATVRLFQRVRESKQINKLPIRQADGTVAVATGVDDFCRLAFGRPRSTMIESAETLEALGEEAYNLASQLGLNRSALRAARALPPEKLELVRTAIVGGSTRAEVLSVIEDLALKAQQAADRANEARADLKAAEELLATKGKTIDKLHRELRRIEKLPPDEQLALLQRDLTASMNEALGAIGGLMRQAVIALRNHGDDPDAQKNVIAGTVAQVQAALVALRDEFGLPDMVGDGTPEWERWARENPLPATPTTPGAKGGKH